MTAGYWFTEHTLLSGAMGMAVGIATAWAVSSYLNHANRQRQLELARAMLEKHFKALGRLDDNETPEWALDLAVRVSQLIRDPGLPGRVSSILDADPDAFRPALERELRVESSWDDIEQLRPNLREALGMANVAGMQAIAARWHLRRPALDEVLVDLGVSPVNEAERILDVRSRATSSRRFPAPALAH